MRNQFGQNIEVGDVVGYVSKRGSYTERKIGRVTSFGQRETYQGVEDILFINWRLDGSYGLAQIDEQGKGVGIDRVFKLDLDGIYVTW